MEEEEEISQQSPETEEPIRRRRECWGSESDGDQPVVETISA
jgi:hypothetical protein